MDIQGKLQFYQMKILMSFLYLLWKNNYLAIHQFQLNWHTDHQDPYYLNSLIVYRNIDILLGDFNIDILEGVRALKEVSNNYNLKVSEPTHLDGALLDHDKHVTSLVNNVYFSDHDVIKVQIIFKDNKQGGVDFIITDSMLPHTLNTNNVMSFI